MWGTQIWYKHCAYPTYDVIHDILEKDIFYLWSQDEYSIVLVSNNNVIKLVEFDDYKTRSNEQLNAVWKDEYYLFPLEHCKDAIAY